MKFLIILTIFLSSTLASPVVSQSETSTTTEKASGEEEEWDDKISQLFEECKINSCTKQQVLDKLNAIIDELMNDVKPGTLDPIETRKEVEDYAKTMDKNLVFNGNDMLELYKVIEVKYKEKFMSGTSTTSTTVATTKKS